MNMESDRRKFSANLCFMAAMGALAVGLSGCGSGVLLGMGKGDVPTRVIAFEDVEARNRHYIDLFSELLGIGRLIPDSTNPMPCGDENKVEVFPNGEFGVSPYHAVTYGDLRNIPSQRIEPAFRQARDALAARGWRIRGFRVNSEAGFIEFSAANPADGYSTNFTGLINEGRMWVSVGSPCAKLPRRRPSGSPTS
ncbi:hypothetical protein [Thermomonospora catenispora]|uniref:hypothetical protein n=1 Tax=Thermomonospora catenispora TaxID=2493090 RepID=UPI0011246468|nr:hypothetical protein [Thermomonospora catenispora]TNY35202.1 hypothetical protein EIO00_19865 [Thermomonospora catenispora]